MPFQIWSCWKVFSTIFALLFRFFNLVKIFMLLPIVFLKSCFSGKIFVTGNTNESILDMYFLKWQCLMVYTLNMPSEFSLCQEFFFCKLSIRILHFCHDLVALHCVALSYVCANWIWRNKLFCTSHTVAWACHASHMAHFQMLWREFFPANVTRFLPIWLVLGCFQLELTMFAL